MAIEPTTITASFFKQIMFLVSIVAGTFFATLTGYNMGRNGIKAIVKEAVYEGVTPLKEQIAFQNSRLEKLERLEKEGSALLLEVSSRGFLTYACLNNFLTSYNKQFNKEFVKPKDIEEKKDKD